MKNKLVRSVLYMFELLLIMSGISIILFAGVVALGLRLTWVQNKNKKLIEQRKKWKNV